MENNKRYDYHFVRQNSDGSWSSKLGYEECIVKSDNPLNYLNDNIYDVSTNYEYVKTLELVKPSIKRQERKIEMNETQLKLRIINIKKEMLYIIMKSLKENKYMLIEELRYLNQEYLKLVVRLQKSNPSYNNGKCNPHKNCYFYSFYYTKALFDTPYLHHYLYIWRNEITLCAT